MWQQEFVWFFTIFHQEFRKNNPIAFEVLIVLAVAHLFGFYNPPHSPYKKSKSLILGGGLSFGSTVL